MKIFTVGGSGLVGSRILEVLKDKYTFTDLSTSIGVDITKPETLDRIKNDTEHEVLIHFAAKADVEGCEKERDLGEESDAYKINVIGTRNVAKACKASGKKLFYISTDFVFNGKNHPPGGYTEDDTPDPVNWYAITKYKGEEEVKAAGIPYAILRIAYPYRKDDFAAKKDFVHAIMGRLNNNLPITAVTDHKMCPTYIDDVASAIDAIINKNASGIFHVVGSESLSPYDAFMLMADHFGYDKSLIGTTTREVFFKDKAPRPFDLSINNDRIEQLGVTMKTFTQGLQEIEK